MSDDAVAMKAELERLRAENSALKTNKEKGLSMKIGEKGGLSVYGLGRFPVTLYKEQWTKLLAMKEDILAFIQANGDKLKTKE
ncbi:MAG: hypothetical protein K1X79_06295 [Oligoflexia bacterium]|nr:hypothetical protein [Oligoflexia bacterium]